MILLVLGSLIKVILSVNRFDAIMSAFFWQSMAGIALVFIFLLVICVISSLVNKEMEVHR